MNVRAAIFDVYGTLLEVASPPPGAEARWQALCRDVLGREAEVSLQAFAAASETVIRREHEAARAKGIAYPEIIWPGVVEEILPGFAQSTEGRREQFICAQMSLVHATRFTAETAEVCRRLKQQGCVLGIASNAQAYTVAELKTGLQEHGLSLELFEPDLCFWSYQHGFSKPDPHVFRLLAARLQMRGIAPEATLMVGDRLDNDIEPARDFGWMTWQITAAPGGEAAGDWPTLLRRIAGRVG